MRNRRSKTILLPALVLVAALALAQGGMFRDKAGNMEVRNIKSWRIQPEGKGKIKFVGVGSPTLKGTWRAQRLTITAGSLEAYVTADSKNAYALDTASMTGGVQVDRESPGSAGGTQSANVKSSTATYMAKEQRIEAKGNVTLHSQDDSIGQTIHATGSAGTILLSDPGARTSSVGRATLSGPVVLKMNAVRQVTEEGTTKKVPYTLDGSADKMEYDAEKRTVTLTGNVKLSGDDPVLAGAEIEAARAVITLLASGEIEAVDFDGEPGRTVYKGQPTGGGSVR